MGELTKDASQEVIITQGTYLASAVCKEQYPEVPRKEIVFIGRSNVGKSSLINSLTRVKNLARVSSQPGKTQTINFYEIGAILNLSIFDSYKLPLFISFAFNVNVCLLSDVII